MNFGALALGAGALLGKAVEGGARIPAGLVVTLFRFVFVTAGALKQVDLFPSRRAHLKFLPDLSGSLTTRPIRSDQ